MIEHLMTLWFSMIRSGRAVHEDIVWVETSNDADTVLSKVLAFNAADLSKPPLETTIRTNGSPLLFNNLGKFAILDTGTGRLAELRWGSKLQTTSFSSAFKPSNQLWDVEAKTDRRVYVEPSGIRVEGAKLKSSLIKMSSVISATLSPSGDRIAVVSITGPPFHKWGEPEGEVSILDVKSHRRRKLGPGAGVEWSSDGVNVVCTVGIERLGREIRIYKVATGSAFRIRLGPSPQVEMVCFDHSARKVFFVATLGGQRALRCYSIPEKKIVQSKSLDNNGRSDSGRLISWKH